MCGEQQGYLFMKKPVFIASERGTALQPMNCYL
jgi:hypothetical protein